MSRVIHLVHFKNDVRHNIGRIKFVCNKIYKRIPNNEVSIKSRQPHYKVGRFKMWVIPFCKITIGVENKDPRMYV